MSTLILNAGSSSLRFTLFDEKLRPLYKGHVDAIGLKHCEFRHYLPEGGEERKKVRIKNHNEAVAYALEKIGDVQIKKVGHRVVHGGEKYDKAVKITAGVLRDIQKLSSLAPLHNPANLAGITAAKKLLKKATHFAIFDTAFHATLPEHAYLYGLPYKLYKKKGIRRYGFHGTSHKYVAEEARKKLKKRNCKLVTCHMGNGVSLAAIKNGVCLDTSMGFTPLEGPAMGTRSGSFDPAILFHLAKSGHKSMAQLEKLVQKESGLLGLSEISSDVRKLRAKMKSPGTQRAFSVLAYQMAKQIAAYFATLGGTPDAVVFTAGIGEHADYLRKQIMGHLKHFKLKTLVIPTNEEYQMAFEIK